MKDYTSLLGLDAALLGIVDQRELILMIIAIAAAVLIGMMVRRFIGEPLQRTLMARLPDTAEQLLPRLAALIGIGTSVLLLWVVTASDTAGGLGATLAAVSLAVAAAMLVRLFARALRAPQPLALGIAVIAALFVLAGALGGLRPLLEALDAASFSYGRHRLSVLDILVMAGIATSLFIGTRIVIRVIDHWIGRTTSLDPAQQVLVQKLAGIAIIIAAIFIGIDLVGLDLRTLTVFSGAFGLAVGFGLQKTFGNLIAGLLLLMDRSIKPGDVIVVGDTFGWVNKIGVRAVSVLTRDGKEHLIPNELLMTERVENWSYSSREVRVHITIGVSYASDLDLVEKLLMEAAVESPRVLPDPAPAIWLMNFGDSSVDFDLIVWIADPEQGVGNVRSDVLKGVWRLFKANGIEIPFPQRDLHVRSMPAAMVPTPPADDAS